MTNLNLGEIFNLDETSKALTAVNHFLNTHPSKNVNFGEFNVALKAVHIAHVFSEEEYDKFSIDRTMMGNAFEGKSTNISKEDRDAFLAEAKVRLHERLGMPDPATIAVMEASLAAPNANGAVA